MFYVVCIYLVSVKWLYKIFLILLSGDVEINPGPRRNTEELFQSATGTSKVSLLTITISCLFLEHILQFINFVHHFVGLALKGLRKSLLVALTFHITFHIVNKSFV